MIINIRGTHGSGKSYIVHRILKQLPTQEVWGNDHERSEAIFEITKQKLVGYVSQLKPKQLLFTVGPYKTQCGGCDAIQPYELIWPRVEEYAKRGHVLFEGALVSSSVGNIGRAMALRKDCVVAFLNTPLEVCLDRIRARRAARGDARELNPRNTMVKYEGILRSRPKLEALGLRCVDINYKRAVAQVLELLR